MSVQHSRQPGNNQRPGTPDDPDTPDYLVPVLATYDDHDEAAKRERATILYCRGHRTADIAALLDVPVTTIRSWLKDARYLLATELRAGREELLLRAIESARALAAEAWTAYERECQLQREILAGQHDYLRRRVTRLNRTSPRSVPMASRRSMPVSVGASAVRPPDNDNVGALPAAPASVGTPTVRSSNDADGGLLYEEYDRPRYTSQAARLLTVALAAQREVARLQGLHKYVAPPPQPVDFHITGPLAKEPTSDDPTSDDLTQADPSDAAPTVPTPTQEETSGDDNTSHAVLSTTLAGPGLAAGFQPAKSPNTHPPAQPATDNNPEHVVGRGYQENTPYEHT